MISKSIIKESVSAGRVILSDLLTFICIFFLFDFVFFDLVFLFLFVFVLVFVSI